MGVVLEDLRAAGLNVEDRAYGFQLIHSDTAGAYTGQCGIDNDLSVSLAIRLNEAPVRWFFRYSGAEMNEFLLESFTAFRLGKFDSLIAAMEHFDGAYDHEKMKRRLHEKSREYRKRFEKRFGVNLDDEAVS